MANYCEYVMRVKGEPQNVDQFVNLMKSVMPSIKPKWCELIANGKNGTELDG